MADFIGGYGDRIAERAGVSKTDTRALYLAYHEGPGGYARGSHRAKPWLERVARKVESRANTYARQYAGCRESLANRSPWWWPF